MFGVLAGEMGLISCSRRSKAMPERIPLDPLEGGNTGKANIEMVHVVGVVEAAAETVSSSDDPVVHSSIVSPSRVNSTMPSKSDF